MKIACIDFETANHSATSICAAGVAMFEGGELRQARHWLVKPPRGHDWFRPDFIGIHGIRPADVRHAPEFPGIADEVLPLLLDADIVVAHNSAFDMKILHRTLAMFCHHARMELALSSANRAGAGPWIPKALSSHLFLPTTPGPMLRQPA